MNPTNNLTSGTAGGRELAQAAAWIQRLPAAMRRLTAALAAYRQRTREFDDLHKLSDRELWDLGLSRSDFTAIEKGVYRRP